MITADQVIVHSTPDRWDALVLIGVGIAVTVTWIVAKDQLRQAARAFWGWVNTRADIDALTRKRTTSWANRWGGDSKSVRQIQADLDAGKFAVRAWPPNAKTTRLADFRKAQTKQKRASA